MKAEFEEKQYEIAACIELAIGVRGKRVFSSGQVLEELLGYDAAADPDPDHPLWKLLELPRPKGIVLRPQHWSPGSALPNGRLPRSTVSIVLQFKRPEYMSHPNAAQWRLWREPFFRFSKQSTQHQVLVALEKGLGNEAVVRYAAPAFVKSGRLELAQLTDSVLAWTGFVSPTDIGSHKTWTYAKPGSEGRCNPSGSRRRFETVEELFDSVGDLGGWQGSSELAIRARDFSPVSDALRHRRPTIRKLVDPWIHTVERSNLGLSAVQLEALREYVTVQSMVRRVRANWMLVSRLPDEA